MKKINEAIIVSVDFTNQDKGVLVVGRPRKGGVPKIINAFQGKEAYDLYMKLITPKEKEN